MSEIVLNIAEWFGIIAFAASGAMVAIDKEFDIFGVLFLGGLTALGGGILRDVLLGNTPPVNFFKYGYLLGAAVISSVLFLVAFAFGEKYRKNKELVNKIVNLLDSVGLGVFTVTGAQAAISAGYFHNWYMVVFLGVMTGIGGGIMRDIIAGDVPFVLRKYVYALAAVIGGILYCLFTKFNINYTLSVLFSVLTVVIIRMLATVFHWTLPRVKLYKDQEV